MLINSAEYRLHLSGILLIESVLKNDCGFWKFTGCMSWVIWLWELGVKFCHFSDYFEVVLNKANRIYLKNQIFEVIRSGFVLWLKLWLKFSQILKNSLQTWHSRHQNHKNLLLSRNSDILTYKLLYSTNPTLQITCKRSKITSWIL